MKIEGKIIHIGEFTQVSDKFAFQPIVIETSGQYPKKVAIQLVRKAIEKAKYLVLGANFKGTIDIQSKEYNGKWFTNISCFEID